MVKSLRGGVVEFTLSLFRLSLTGLPDSMTRSIKAPALRPRFCASSPLISGMHEPQWVPAAAADRVDADEPFSAYRAQQRQRPTEKHEQTTDRQTRMLYAQAPHPR